MDLMAMQKKSILIPTPGQTEQEYLGEYLMKKKIALYVNQNDFTLSAALKLADNYKYDLPSPANNETLKKVIANFLHQLSIPAFG
jgi:UDP-N-acetylglucosamine:LPS N-acetylglucosamine transferase